MRERHVLASCIQSREAYDAIADHVVHDDFSEQGWIVWGGISDYYTADVGCSRVDVGILMDSIARKVSSDKHKEAFRNFISAVGGLEVSPPNVVEDLLNTKRDIAGKRLAQSIVEGVHDWSLLDTYTTLLETDSFLDDDEEDARQGYDVSDLVAGGFARDNLISVYPESLNNRLDGGAKPGHHIVLYARPEMGKTAMTIEMMAGFARQGLTTLYVGNEDPIDDITMRVVNRLSGMTKPEVLKNPKRADHVARENGYESIILKGVAPGTAREITSLVEAHRPNVMVIDQLRNLNMHQDNYVLALEQAAKQARMWAKKYKMLVVSVTQAGDSASGKAVLDLGDVDYSNTGIPSQADLMIGMGQNSNHAAAGEVVISLPKNKISGCHEYFACAIEPQLSKIVSLG